MFSIGGLIFARVCAFLLTREGSKESSAKGSAMRPLSAAQRLRLERRQTDEGREKEEKEKRERESKGGTQFLLSGGEAAQTRMQAWGAR